jgi:DNA-binding MarR family transcriptional regulator
MCGNESHAGLPQDRHSKVTSYSTPAQQCIWATGELGPNNSTKSQLRSGLAAHRTVLNGTPIRLLSLRHRARAAPLLAPLGLHPSREALLLELDRTGPRIQAQLSEALGCEPPSVTLMTRKLEATGHIRRKPAPSDKRASIVELTDSGKALADQVKRLWCALAEETVAGLPAETTAKLPGILNTLTSNVDTRRSTTHTAAGTV